MYEISDRYVPWGNLGSDDVYWLWFVEEFIMFNERSCDDIAYRFVSETYMSLLSGALPGDV